MFSALDISTSGLIAQRTRLTTISANLANTMSLTNDAGEYDPYRRRYVEFAPGDPTSGSTLGVHVRDVKIDGETPLVPRFQPGHEFADDNGMVHYPNVNSVIEQMNAMEAARAYEANISVIEATKSMYSLALEVLA